MTLERSAQAFVRDLGHFAYDLSVLDHVWNVLFPDQRGTWHRLHVNKYKQVFFVTDADGRCGSLEIVPGKSVRTTDEMGSTSSPLKALHTLQARAWEALLAAACKWLIVVQKDWVTANRRTQIEYPLQHRYGIVSNAVIRALLPGIYRLDKELGAATARRFVGLVEQGFFLRSDHGEVSTMTADDYFRYCKIAYVAGRRQGETVDTRLSGREMYAQYADGRHEGLLDIAPNSAKEFEDWIDGTHPKRTAGGHPWEIKRGGNTTHIDLAVFRPSSYQKEGFRIELRGESIGRLAETIRMFLAIHKAKLPISIANPEGVRKRLLAQDNIGIIPSDESPHRANQRFGEEQDVFDVMHYDDCGRFKRRILPFIAWEPLPILRPS